MVMIRNIFWVFSYICIILFGNIAYAQDVKLELGSTDIGVNQEFTITLSVQNERLRKYGEFPEISGFQKAGTSSSSSTSIVNGQISSTQSVTQTYLPTREGTFKLSAFSMNVNDTEVRSPGATIKVGPERGGNARNNPFNDPFFDDPFDRYSNRGKDEYMDIKADAFLALTTDKDEVYVGEGVTTTLAFYVSEQNQAQLQFYDLGKQLTSILKEIRPSSCWEENFNIENISRKKVRINQKNYDQYKIYQATFYPFNQEPIEFPQIGLDMIKYKVSKNPSFFGRNKKEDFKKFYTKAKTVTVKPLPSHPLKDMVAVGNYQLDEQIETTALKTGESFNYSFKIVGEGNISAIEKPIVQEAEAFDIYAPSIQQDINRRNNRVTGAKAFAYYAVPNEPGEYELSDYFQWIYFDPDKQVYDTLVSDITVEVTGKSRKNEAIQASDVGPFYDRIEFIDNNLVKLDRDKWLQLMANILILSVLVLSVVIVFKK